MQTRSEARICTRGLVNRSRRRPPVELARDTDDPRPGERLRACRRPPRCAVGRGYSDSMQAFIDGIHGQPMRCGSGLDGRIDVADCLALFTSSRDQRWVKP